MMNLIALGISWTTQTEQGIKLEQSVMSSEEHDFLLDMWTKY